MARTTRVDSGTEAESWEMVAPAKMEMTSLSCSASAMPSAVKMDLAICGLQLRAHQHKPPSESL